MILHENNDYVFPHFNFTRIDELKLPASKGQLTPRIVLEAIDEIRGRETGYHELYENHIGWRKTFDPETDLPTYKDVYGPKENGYHILRTVNFIKTKREQEIGIGEEWTQGPLKFGECLVGEGWTHEGEVEIFKFRFDYKYLVAAFNQQAEIQGWKKVPNGDKMINTWTQMPCNARHIKHSEIH